MDALAHLTDRQIDRGLSRLLEELIADEAAGGVEEVEHFLSLQP